MNINKHKQVLEDFFKAKRYIVFLLVFIVFYSYKQQWDVVFILCVLFMVFINMKKKLKKNLIDVEEFYGEE